MSVQEYQSFLASRFGSDADAVFAEYPADSTAEIQIRLAQIMENKDFIDSVKFAAGSMGDITPDTYMYRYSYIIPGQPKGHSMAASLSCSSGSPVSARIRQWPTMS